MHTTRNFTSFVTFSDLIWKNTAEDEEHVLAEVCSCDLTKKIHFLHHAKKQTKKQQKKNHQKKTQNQPTTKQTKKPPKNPHFLAHGKRKTETQKPKTLK